MIEQTELEAAIELCSAVHADGNSLTGLCRKGSFNYAVAVLADEFLAEQADYEYDRLKDEPPGVEDAYYDWRNGET